MDIILDEFSIAYIALTQWAPPLITVLLGGLLASILFPRWQDRYARYHAREERKLALAEQLSKDMTRYVTYWNRLRTIAELESSRTEGLSDAEFSRKQAFIDSRNSSRDSLIDTLCSTEVYFSEEVQTAIDEFLRWDESCTSLRLDELPDREEYTHRRRKILAVVHKEVSR